MNQNAKQTLKKIKKTSVKIGMVLFFGAIIFLISFNPLYSSQNSINDYSTVAANSTAPTYVEESTPKSTTSPSANGEAGFGAVSNEADVFYDFDPGSDENGDPYEVTNVTLTGKDITDNYVIDNDDPLGPSGDISVVGLRPHTSYNDWMVHVTFTDGITYDQNVRDFFTLGVNNPPSSIGETETTDITESSAILNYSFDPGVDENGDSFIITEITVTGTGITDNYIVDSPTSPTGTITLQDLQAGTNYDDLVVNVTFTDEFGYIFETYSQNVDPFTTQDAIIPPSSNVFRWIIIILFLILLIALTTILVIFSSKFIKNLKSNKIN
ncbi:MAG: hypothetical protein GQ557_01810 [Mycoplasmataceae bacterium]|nr:hypothetical protein [Mycoplasmataceae bacterium]